MSSDGPSGGLTGLWWSLWRKLGVLLVVLLPCGLRILWKKNEVADYEATTFSIFYNNTLFLVLVIVASFFLLKNFNPTVYPLIALLLVL